MLKEPDPIFVEAKPVEPEPELRPLEDSDIEKHLVPLLDKTAATLTKEPRTRDMLRVFGRLFIEKHRDKIKIEKPSK